MNDDAQPNADMSAMPGKSRDGIVALYRWAWQDSDTTIEMLERAANHFKYPFCAVR